MRISSVLMIQLAQPAFCVNKLTPGIQLAPMVKVDEIFAALREFCACHCLSHMAPQAKLLRSGGTVDASNTRHSTSLIQLGRHQPCAKRLDVRAGRELPAE